MTQINTHQKQTRTAIARLLLRQLIPVITVVMLINLSVSIYPTFYFDRIIVELAILSALMPAIILYKLRHELIAIYLALGLISLSLGYSVIHNGGVLTPAYVALIISLIFVQSVMPFWITSFYYLGTMVLGAYTVFQSQPIDRSILPTDLYFWIVYTSFGALIISVQRITSKTLKSLLEQNIDGRSQLFSAINAISDPLLILGERGEIIKVNTASTSFQTELEGVFHQSILDITWERDHNEMVTLRQLIQSNILSDHLKDEEQTQSHQVELRLRLYQGYRWYLVSLNTYHHHKGVGGVIHIREITAQRKLIQVQKMDAVGQMASGLAHEFNNMLSAIIGSVDLLRFDPRDDQLELINFIDEATHRASRLTKQLLMFTRKRPQFSKVVDLHHIIDSSVTLLQGALDKKIKLLVVRSLNKPTVKGDERLLTSAILNLIINSAQSMPNGGLVTLKTTEFIFNEDEVLNEWHGNELEKVPYISLEVIDHGAGISSEVIDHIFEPFFSTRGYSDTGIGLTAVYGAVTKHRGAIRVTSTEGQGSNFQVILPYVEADHLTNNLDQLPKKVSLSKGLKVLLVDDEEIIRSTVSRLLKTSGFTVVLASNGLEGVEAYQVDHFDLVILDMLMPVMNGLEALKLMKAHRPDVPVIIHSGYARDDDLEQLSRLGVSQVLTKPSRHSDLLKAINLVLDEKNS